MRIRSRSAWAIGVLGLVLLAGGTAPIRAAPPRTCAGAKANAVTGAVAARGRCQAKARATETDVDGVCLAKVDATLLMRFARADKSGACPGDAASAQETAADCVAAFDAATTGSASCAARKIKAAAKNAAGKGACAGKPACLAKVEVAFAAAMTKADHK